MIILTYLKVRIEITVYALEYFSTYLIPHIYTLQYINFNNLSFNHKNHKNKKFYNLILSIKLYIFIIINLGLNFIFIIIDNVYLIFLVNMNIMGGIVIF